MKPKVLYPSKTTAGIGVLNGNVYGLSQGAWTQDVHRTDEVVMVNRYPFTVPRSSIYCVHPSDPSGPRPAHGLDSAFSSVITICSPSSVQLQSSGVTRANSFSKLHSKRKHVTRRAFKLGTWHDSPRSSSSSSPPPSLSLVFRAWESHHHHHHHHHSIISIVIIIISFLGFRGLVWAPKQLRIIHHHRKR